MNITPATPAWLSGFAARDKPAETVAQNLWAKALVIEDARGARFVLVTADIIGFTREITDEIAARAERKHGLSRKQVLFNASHTHSGPSIWPRLHVAGGFGPEIEEQVRTYATKLIEDVDRVIGDALKGMQTARLDFAEGQADFAINRRAEHLAGIRPGESFPSPIDKSVPVLRVSSPGGKPLAIVFGYACHNTVLTAEINEISGDYAGHAQLSLEGEYPGATALFVTLCAGDQRPAPRGKRELARSHGEALAASVSAALAARARPISGEIATAYELTSIPFQVHTRETYAGESQSDDPFLARRGRVHLEAFDRKRPVRSTPYPLQAVRFGDGPVWVALGGEVVVDYQLRLKSEYQRVTVLGYSNDVMGYIPSKRVQREGGYEAGDALMYFSQPGWFTEEVEEIVLGAARRVLGAAGATSTGATAR